MKIPKIYSIAFFSTVFFSCGDNVPSSNNLEEGGNQNNLQGNTGGTSGGGGARSSESDLVAGKKILQDARVKIEIIRSKCEHQIRNAEWKLDIDNCNSYAAGELSKLIKCIDMVPDKSGLSSEFANFDIDINAINDSLASLSKEREVSLMKISGNVELKKIIDVAIEKLNDLEKNIRSSSNNKGESLHKEMKTLLDDLEKSVSAKINKDSIIDRRLLGRERFDSLYKGIEEHYFSTNFAQTAALQK